MCSNAAILVGRKGEVMGIYRKVHLVVSLERGTMENGATPDRELPVFDCVFLVSCHATLRADSKT